MYQSTMGKGLNNLILSRQNAYITYVLSLMSLFMYMCVTHKSNSNAIRLPTLRLSGYVKKFHLSETMNQVSKSSVLCQCDNYLTIYLRMVVHDR